MEKKQQTECLNNWKKGRLAACCVMLLSLFFSCEWEQQAGYVPIPAVQIGDQIWMSTNLDVVTFRNGDTIPHLSSTEAWEQAGKEGRPGWCFYGNDQNVGKKYGRMYNWYAVNDPRGLAPSGWHIPTDEDWLRLENNLGREVSGTHLKCDKGWMDNGNGDNASAFCALPGGYRYKNGNFTGLEEFTYLTGITEDKLPDAPAGSPGFIWGRGIHHANSTIMRCGLDKEFGLYVRCIKDKDE